MPDQETWSEDVCTCGHTHLEHVGSQGECGPCQTNTAYSRGKPCPRYQWNGKPRVRTW